MRKASIILALTLTAASTNATTIWCKSFNLGCPNQEEIRKAMANCQNLANQTREKALIEALADPTIWKLDGSKSAEDYANMRHKVMLSICIGKSSDLRN